MSAAPRAKPSPVSETVCIWCRTKPASSAATAIASAWSKVTPSLLAIVCTM
jgi:hypothetical protein